MNSICMRRCVCAIAVLSIPTLLPAAPPEFRGLWVSRFNWTQDTNKEQPAVQKRIDDILNAMQKANFNAIMFQVRGQCDTLYPSPEEPWSDLLSPDGNTPPGFEGWDPVQYALVAAHVRGLEFHAYFNVFSGWQAGTSPSYATPDYCGWHPFWKYFNIYDANLHPWSICDVRNSPYYFNEYYWLAPGHPEVQAYVRRQLMHLVKKYDIDGVHFDRIRTPAIQSGSTYYEWSHDPVSQARFNGEGNPDHLGWHDWMRDQITRWLRDAYAQTMEQKPRVKMSSSPLGLYRPGRYVPLFGGPAYPSSSCGFQYEYSCVYQDGQGWLAAGAQDFVVPQIYWPDPPRRAANSNPHFSEVAPDWLKNTSGRHIYCGQTRAYGTKDVFSQIGVTRSLSQQENTASGNVVFSYSAFTPADWDDYSDPNPTPNHPDGPGPYAEPAPLPEMPWKTHATQGIIIGNVTAADGVTPIVDAHINRTPDDAPAYTALSSGDGLYSFLKVEPGTYTLTLRKNGLADCEISNVVVTAGEVTRVDVSLGAAPRITAQPVAAVLCTGDSAELKVEVARTCGLSFRWQKDGVDLSDDANVTGATTPILQLAAVALADAGGYRCVVTNTFGTTVSDEAALAIPDNDGDNLADCVDTCPASDLSAVIAIGDCDTGVTNQLLESGCTMADAIAKSAAEAGNHGEFVSAVAHLTNDWKDAGLISGADKGKIQSCAAKSDLPAAQNPKSVTRNLTIERNPELLNLPVPQCGAGAIPAALLTLTGLLMLGGRRRR